MLSRLLVARVLAWGSGLASCVGEPGGTREEGVRRSRICPPWKVLLTVEPRDRRDEGVEDEEETPEAPAMLWVEGEAGGRRWDKELEETGGERSLSMDPFRAHSHKSNFLSSFGSEWLELEKESDLPAV